MAAAMFCVPNTTGSAFPATDGAWGFGCGAGICAPNGQYCVCDATHEHSSYFLYMQDCWDPLHLQVSLLIITSIMMLVGGAYSAYMVRRTRSEVRAICLGAAMCNVTSLLANLTLYLEGFNGLATSTFMCTSVFFGIRTIGQVCWLFLKPSLRMSGQSAYTRYERLPKLYVPGAMFVGMWLPNVAAYATVTPFPEDRNFLEFNRRMSGFFFVSAVLPYVVCFAPFLYMLILFERVFVRSDSRSGEGEITPDSTAGGRGTSGREAGSKIDSQQPPSTPKAPNHMIRTSVLYTLLRKVTLMLLGTMIVTSVTGLYMFINVLMYNQTPIQILVFIFFKLYGPALSILVRFFVRQAQQTLDSSKQRNAQSPQTALASKTFPSKEETMVASPSNQSKRVGSDNGTAW